MDKERNSRKYESVYSNRIRAGKRRTYFFDVRKTKGNDYYLTLTESTKKFNGEGYERHKIFLYKEDFNRFLDGLQDTIDHVKNELMPDYDYDEFTRRHEAYENEQNHNSGNDPQEEPPKKDPEEQVKTEDDISW